MVLTDGSALGFSFFQSSLWAIAHEYIHVLQYDLTKSRLSPTWLVEGMANYYGDYQYGHTQLGVHGRRHIQDSHSPYNDLRCEAKKTYNPNPTDWNAETDVLPNLAAELRKIEDYQQFHRWRNESHSYALGFVAAVYMVEELGIEDGAFLRYWRILAEDRTAQQAFEEAFDMTMTTFYDSFGVWVHSGVVEKRVEEYRAEYEPWAIDWSCPTWV